MSFGLSQRYRIHFLVIGAALSLGLTACQSEDQQRIAAGNEWLAQAEVVATVSHVSEAGLIVQYLHSSAEIAKPAANGVTILTRPDSVDEVVIVPLLDVDRPPNGSEQWTKIMNSSELTAGLIGPEQWIILNDRESFSSLWKGLLMLYAGDLSWQERYGPPATHGDSVLSEILAQQFLDTVTNVVGGEMYRHVIHDEIARQKEFFSQSGMKPGEDFAHKGEYDRRLDAIFGPTVSIAEKQGRRQQVYVHGTFTLLDETITDDQGVGAKAYFLHKLKNNAI